MTDRAIASRRVPVAEWPSALRQVERELRQTAREWGLKPHRVELRQRVERDEDEGDFVVAELIERPLFRTLDLDEPFPVVDKPWIL